MSESWTSEFRRCIKAWDGTHIITSPDVDGILSATLLAHLYGARLAGVYTTRYLILFDGVTPQQAKSALWLDHDISHEGIQCMGQHLVDHSPLDRLPKRGANSFNPNQFFRQTWKSSFYGSSMKEGKRDKYPYATIHFLMAGLDVPDPTPGTAAFALLAHADGSWGTCVDYRLNTLTWKGTMFGDSRPLVNELNDGYVNDDANLDQHQSVVDALIGLGINKRGSRSGASSLIPKEWKGIQGKQSVNFRKGTEPHKWLASLNGVMGYISTVTGWSITLPSFVSEMHRGLVLTLGNRGEVDDGDFDQFMYDEDMFSHAITGAGAMRFTKGIRIADTIESYQQVPLPRRLQ